MSEILTIDTLKKVDVTSEAGFAEYQKKLQENIDEFKQMVDEINSMDKLQELYDQVNQNMDKDKEYFDNLTYELTADSVEYRNQTYQLNQVSMMICDFLETQEVEWSFTLALLELVDFWRKFSTSFDWTKDLSIPYPVLDSTLHFLKNCKFKGYNDWLNILVVNEYFAKCVHRPYTRDKNWLYYNSSLMNILENRAKLVSREEHVVDDATAVAEDMAAGEK